MSSHLIVSLGILSLLAGNTAFAGHGHPPGPCEEMHAACKAQGFYKGGESKGMGIRENCMKVLLSGGTVPKVTVPAATISACKAKMEARRAGAHGAPVPSGSGAPVPADQE